MRRDKQKVKAKAKKAATMESFAAPAERQTSPATEPPKKKQKSDETTSSPPLAVESVQLSRRKEARGIAAIARSASDRARAARAKATKVHADQT